MLHFLNFKSLLLGIFMMFMPLSLCWDDGVGGGGGGEEESEENEEQEEEESEETEEEEESVDDKDKDYKKLKSDYDKLKKKFDKIEADEKKKEEDELKKKGEFEKLAEKKDEENKKLKEDSEKSIKELLINSGIKMALTSLGVEEEYLNIIVEKIKSGNDIEVDLEKKEVKTNLKKLVEDYKKEHPKLFSDKKVIDGEANPDNVNGEGDDNLGKKEFKKREKEAEERKKSIPDEWK